MKSTGVVRRVDDLGRIVIPKEIRRNLRIRDGEELEIFVDNDLIYLKKFSKLSDLSAVSKKIIDVASALIGKTILISNRDFIYNGSGELKKKYINKELSKVISEKMLNGNVLINRSINSDKLSESVEDNSFYALRPILCYGDVIGSVISLSNNSEISDYDLSIINLIAQFLGKYVEE